MNASLIFYRKDTVNSRNLNEAKNKEESLIEKH